MTRENRTELIGWTSGVLCLVAYGLMTQQIVTGNSLTFLGMNAAGCIGLIYYTYSKRATANAALNTVHLTITMIAFVRKFL